ncbi:MAG: hypothetical protein EOO09_14125 [Chitinophagaceae bacterium]|nr:MAG: hypothetical protein EOO09_14125 [Chitinophagaceae bacterium]
MFPEPFSALAPQSLIDSLRSAGTMIYDGNTPPVINGIYLMSPDSCTYDNSPGNSRGQLYTDYKFRFSEQDNNAFTIKLEQKAIPANTVNPLPVKTYISGSGNNFSIITLRTKSLSGVDVENINIFSGTLTTGGIRNLQNTLYIRSKGNDPNNTVAPAGTIRVFITGRAGLAVTQTGF